MSQSEITEDMPSQASDTSDIRTLKVYKREAYKRVFVNRGLLLDTVKFYGFDMDYTIAVYKSPEYETLGFDLIKNKLLEMGYPEPIGEFEYDPTFPIRGLWFDSTYGNLLKCDPFGNIMVCVHGFKFMNRHEIHKIYPNKFVNREDDPNRFRIFNTLYELPGIYILACIVDFFSNHEDFKKVDNGVKSGDITMTYMSIYQDVLAATDYVHTKTGPLKTETAKNLEKYVIKDDRLPILLDRMRLHGSKVFLATNSDYIYTNKVMKYLLDYDEKRDWTDYFDYIVVDARKPLFFEGGTILREVVRDTGKLQIGSHTGPIKSGKIYSGGSVDVFSDIMGVLDKEVLYIGDHIFGDILKSKKMRGWRTFLIVPELAHELRVWTEKQDFFTQLEDFDANIGEIYRNLDSSSKTKPDISNIQKAIRDVTHHMDMAYGMLGSLFRSGSRQTFFGNQVMRYADLYAASFLNLLHYPFSYVFRSPAMLMPHESTVRHEDRLPQEAEVMASRSREFKEAEERRKRLQRSDSTVPHLYANTPHQLTQILDDEESLSDSN
ncbi:cytosolic purine 5'-nucleotidase-like [Mytilus californianus]|uniref:cytosolic purine 5'-nucleotidase-like n=1 Tax=Mytilus californianus TaxID=6549 RepID=UPI002245C214|nr:cytosolic purine 5'-nucleotidase-like [Mytilus californianus]